MDSGGLTLLGYQIFIEGLTYKEHGIISFAEGNYLEVQMFVPKQLTIGDNVQCRIVGESSHPLELFFTHIVAKKKDSIILLLPSTLKERWIIAREAPRIRLQGEGSISAVSFNGGRPLIELTKPSAITLHDISEGGIGFSTDLYIRENGLAQLCFKLTGKKIYIEVQINKLTFDIKEQVTYYGASFTDDNSTYREIIHSYIVQNQLKQLLEK